MSVVKRLGSAAEAVAQVSGSVADAAATVDEVVEESRRVLKAILLTLLGLALAIGVAQLVTKLRSPAPYVPYEPYEPNLAGEGTVPEEPDAAADEEPNQ